MKSGSGFLLVFFILSSKVIPGLILILLIIQENSLLVFAKQEAKNLWRSDDLLNHRLKQLCSHSLPDPPGCVRKSPQSGPDISYSFNLYLVP